MLAESRERLRRPIVVALAASLSSLSPGALAANASADAQQPRIVYYDVTGNSARQLRAQLDALGSMDPAEHRRFDGQTRWTVSWNYRYELDAAGCMLRSFDVTLDTTMTLPRWMPTDNARASLREDWQRYQTALRTHEDGHQAIGQTAADAVKARFQQVIASDRPSPDCAALSSMLDAAGKAILADNHARERDYDRTTAHGATQGAQFPP